MGDRHDAKMSWKNGMSRHALRGLLWVGKAIPIQGIPILTYHSIDRTGGPTSVSPEIFERQMERVRASGYRSVTLSQLDAQGRANDGPPVVLTLDDGYENQFTEAFPILKKCGLTATVFIITDCMGKLNDWETDRRIPRLKHLDERQIREMSEYGIEFGSHTCTHPNLTALAPESARKEIETSKRVLEKLLGTRVESFCYPFGAVNERVKRLVADAGFSHACTLEYGMSQPADDPLLLRRFGMNRISARDSVTAELYLLNCLLGSASLYIGLRDRLRPSRALPGMV